LTLLLFYFFSFPIHFLLHLFAVPLSSSLHSLISYRFSLSLHIRFPFPFLSSPFSLSRLILSLPQFLTLFLSLFLSHSLSLSLNNRESSVYLHHLYIHYTHKHCWNLGYRVPSQLRATVTRSLHLTHTLPHTCHTTQKRGEIGIRFQNESRVWSRFRHGIC
jgi:hypothetical protein